MTLREDRKTGCGGFLDFVIRDYVHAASSGLFAPLHWDRRRSTFPVYAVAGLVRSALPPSIPGR